MTALHRSHDTIDGQLVEVVTADDHAAAELLDLATAYRRAAVPGVIGVRSFTGEPAPRLVLTLPGDETWATLPPPAGSLRSHAAILAATVAHIHERELVHGALRPEAVHVDRRGEPVLGGFAPGVSGAPEDDVRALARMIAELAGRAGGGPELAEVVAICERVANAPAPEAVTLAAELSRPVRQRTRGVRWALAVAVMVVGALGLVFGRHPTPPGTAAGSATSTAAAPDVMSTTDTTTARLPAAPSPTSVIGEPPTATTAAPSPTTEASGPPTTAVPVPTTGPGDLRLPPIVVHDDGRSFAAGRPGDVAVVVDLTCDGTAAVVLARPGTGEVYLWRQWPDDASTVGEPLGTLPRLTGFADPAVPECGAIGLVTEAGPATLRPGGNR